jgi:hypothetical protein
MRSDVLSPAGNGKRVGVLIPASNRTRIPDRRDPEKHRMKLATWTTVLLLALGVAAASAPPPAAAATAKDPSAMALLKRMCDRLQATKTFTVRGQVSLELPLTGGTLATFFNDYEVSVRRPDGLAARRSGDLPDFRFAYDGKSTAVLVPGEGKWGSTSAPATLDAMLPAAEEHGDLNMPFDELLVADPYAAVVKGVTEVERAGQATIRGKKVEHLVLPSPELHVEYWIDPDTALPGRSLVVYVDHPLRPHFVVEHAEWKLDPKLPAATFTLSKPQGASEVSFRDAADSFR